MEELIDRYMGVSIKAFMMPQDGDSKKYGVINKGKQGSKKIVTVSTNHLRVFKAQAAFSHNLLE